MRVNAYASELFFGQKKEILQGNKSADRVIGNNLVLVFGQPLAGLAKRVDHDRARIRSKPVI